jgi:hypothetical protein
MTRGALFLVAMALLGCSSSASQLTVKVEAPPSVNGGLPMQMLVRNVDSATFSGESYPTAAAMVVTPDPTVMKSEVVYPGVSFSLSVAKPEKGDIGLYFFFLTPGSEWKVLLPRPFDKPLQIRLGKDRVEAR